MINADKLVSAMQDVQTKQGILNKATEARDKASSDLAVAVTKAAEDLDVAKAKASELKKEFDAQVNPLLQ